MQRSLIIIAAYKAEVSAIIEKFKLSPVAIKKGFDLYMNDRICVCVCGEGYENASVSTHCLIDYLEMQGIENPTWLNFGIAGAKSWPIGTLIFGDSVYCQVTGVEWPLETGIITNEDTGRICTVKCPSSDYQADYQAGLIYEMEAAGIMSVINERKGGLVNVYVAKLITDTPENPIGVMTMNDIKQLLHVHRSKVLEMVEIISR